MKKLAVSFFTALFAAVLFLCFAPSADAADLAGYCRSVLWEFDPETGTLSLSGYGPMPNFVPYRHEESSAPDHRLDYQKPPWEAYLSEIRSIRVKTGVTTIGTAAFMDCGNLFSVYLPDGLETVGDQAFRNCFSLKKLSFSEGLTAIGAMAFSGCGELQEIRLPDSLISVGSAAFLSCKKATRLTLGPNLVRIGERAFGHCESIDAVEIPPSVEKVGIAAFENDVSLKRAVIECGEIHVEKLAFWKCAALREIVLRGGSISAEATAFEECPALAELTVEAMNSFTDTVFAGCASLETVTIGEGVKTLGAGVFKNCEKLRKAVLPDDLRIGRGAFAGTLLIRHDAFYSSDGALYVGAHLIAVKDRVRGIFRVRDGVRVAGGAFENVWSSIDVTVPANSFLDPDAFILCKGLHTVICEGETELDPDMFYGCSSLVAAVLPSGTRTIGSWTFAYNDALRAVVLPKGVTRIDEYAFAGCEALETVYFEGTREEWEKVEIRDQFGMNGVLGEAEIVFLAPLAMPDLSETGLFPQWAPYAGVLALLLAALGASLWVRRIGK